MRKVMTTVLLIACATPALAAITFGLGDIDKIIDTSRHNEARFNRDYKGQGLTASLIFDKLQEKFFGDGWQVEFKYPGSGIFGGVDCTVDEAQARALVDWNQGRQVQVSGMIDTTIMGTLLLRDCRFN
jgi:hypothetical protein